MFSLAYPRSPAWTPPPTMSSVTVSWSDSGHGSGATLRFDTCTFFPRDAGAGADILKIAEVLIIFLLLMTYFYFLKKLPSKVGASNRSQELEPSRSRSWKFKGAGAGAENEKFAGSFNPDFYSNFKFNSDISLVMFLLIRFLYTVYRNVQTNSYLCITYRTGTRILFWRF